MVQNKPGDGTTGLIPPTEPYLTPSRPEEAMSYSEERTHTKHETN